MDKKRSASFTSDNKPLAVALRRLMEESGETQKALASALGMKQQTISYYRNGISSPDTEGLIKIARHYGVSTDYLLGMSDYKNKENEHLTAIELGLTEMSVEKLKMQKHLESLIGDKFEKKGLYTCLETINLVIGTKAGSELISCIDNYLNSNFNGNVTFTPTGGEPMKHAIKDSIAVPKLTNGNATEFKIDTEEMLEAWFSKKVTEFLTEIKRQNIHLKTCENKDASVNTNGFTERIVELQWRKDDKEV